MRSVPFCPKSMGHRSECVIYICTDLAPRFALLTPRVAQMFPVSPFTAYDGQVSCPNSCDRPALELPKVQKSADFPYK